MSNQYNLVLSAIKTQVDRLCAPSSVIASESADMSSKAKKERERKRIAE